jgi:hypothetical protein
MDIGNNMSKREAYHSHTSRAAYLHSTRSLLAAALKGIPCNTKYCGRNTELKDVGESACGRNGGLQTAENKLLTVNQHAVLCLEDLGNDGGRQYGKPRNRPICQYRRREEPDQNTGILLSYESIYKSYSTRKILPNSEH